MSDTIGTKDGFAAQGFSEAAISKDLALIELVRHLARISAENDYNAFLESLGMSYSGGAQKGPRP